MCKCKKSAICQNREYLQNREFCKIVYFFKSGSAHSHSNGVLDNYSCGSKNNCLQNAIGLLQFKCANVKNREFVKIGNFAKSGIFQNREASSWEIDYYSCGAKKIYCHQHAIVQFKCANVKNPEFVKIENFSKSRGIEWGNRPLQLRC